MQTSDLTAAWGRRLTAARQARGLSIGELARRTGIHKSQLARFEKGEAGLGDAARIRVAAAIGQQVAALFPYPHITPESVCPNAASATDAASSPRQETPADVTATRHANQSAAPSATGAAASTSEGSRNE